MNKKKKLPVGIEFFEKIRKNDYYYVDKTKLIETLLDTGNEVTLFTRPRRFGKSLTMDMLKCFFEVGTEKDRFDGLYISGNAKLCEAYMGKFPVVSISLKSVNAGSYEDARDFLIGIINEESLRFQFLLESEKLTKAEKLQFEKLLEEDMKLRTLASSLRKLTDLLVYSLHEQDNQRAGYFGAQDDEGELLPRAVARDSRLQGRLVRAL